MPLAPQHMRTYSLTAVTAGRRRLFQVATTANLMMDVLQHYRNLNRYSLHAFVIMPDHMHLLLTPAPDVSVEKTMQLIKGGFSFRLKSKMDVWDRGYFDRRIADASAFHTCREYIEQNPVRARITPTAIAYPCTSAGRRELIDDIPEWFVASPQG